MAVKPAGDSDAKYRGQLGKELGIKIPKEAKITASKDGIVIETDKHRIEFDNNGVKREYDRITCPDTKNFGQFSRLFGPCYEAAPKITSIKPDRVARAEEVITKEQEFSFKELVKKIASSADSGMKTKKNPIYKALQDLLIENQRKSCPKCGPVSEDQKDTPGTHLLSKES